MYIRHDIIANNIYDNNDVYTYIHLYMYRERESERDIDR